MSTLSVTTVSTANGTTDLTLASGNSSAGDIIISSNGTLITLAGNSSTNTLRLSPNGHIVFANATANTLYLVSNGNVGIGSSTPASELYVKRGTVAFEPANSGYYAASFYAAQNATTNYGLQVRTNWQATENKIVSFGVVDAGTGTDTERFAVNGVGTVTISSNTLTLGTSTAAANGYTFLPNGLKMVWGMVAAANTAAGTFVTYASAFTTATYVVQVSHQGNARTVAPLVVASNTTGANISSGIAATAGTNVYFTAIGI